MSENEIDVSTYTSATVKTKSVTLVDALMQKPYENSKGKYMLHSTHFDPSEQQSSKQIIYVLVRVVW
jgi:hypothetical protein